MSPTFLALLLCLSPAAARAASPLSTFMDGRIVAINRSARPVTVNFYSRDRKPVKSYKLESPISRTYIDNNHLAISYQDKRGWRLNLYESQGRQLADLSIDQDDPSFYVTRKNIMVGRPGTGVIVLSLQGKVLERRAPSQNAAVDPITR
jgi:hypothetical protein